MLTHETVSHQLI